MNTVISKYAKFYIKLKVKLSQSSYKENIFSNQVMVCWISIIYMGGIIINIILYKRVINLLKEIRNEILCVQNRKNRCVSSVKLSINLPHQPNIIHYCYKKRCDTVRNHVTLVENNQADELLTCPKIKV